MTEAPSAAARRQLTALRLARQQSGATQIADELAAFGITHVFCVGGQPIDLLLGACAKRGLRLIGARQQSGAGLMSAAFNFISGSLRSVVVVSCGPAVMNLATAILFAHDNDWPLLVVSGRFAAPGTPSHDLLGAFQRFDAAGHFASITRWSGLITEPAQARDLLAKAIAAASGPVRGPAILDVAAEAIGVQAIVPAAIKTRDSAVVQAANAAEGSAAAPVTNAPLAATEEPFINAAKRLIRAQRPLMLIGPGLRWSAPWHTLAHLAEVHGIAFAASPMARGFLSDDHPACRILQRAQTAGTSDVVLIAGTRLDWTFRHGAELAPSAQLIRLASDDRRDDGSLVVPGLQDAVNSAIVLPGEPGAALARLADALDRHSSGRELAQVAGQIPAERPLTEARAGGAAGLAPQYWLAEAASTLPKEAITVLDGNVVMTLAQRLLSVRLPVSRLTPGANGTMGVGLPFAIGAQLACPQRPVVLFTGDFAIGTQLAEFETAARHRVGITVVVANNAGAGGTVRQDAFLGGHPESVLSFSTSARYDRIAQALGCEGVRVDAPGQLTIALAAAIARAKEGVASSIDVATDRAVPVAAAI